ncbi:MAG TPA: hypothetical protein DF296_02015 [Candidatus Margulisbacteria bacterium]|nr:hypothetical protein [Candidatus Margulisiibacteriota bacterium]
MEASYARSIRNIKKELKEPDIIMNSIKIMLCPSDNRLFSHMLNCIEKALIKIGATVIRLSISKNNTNTFHISTEDLNAIHFFAPDYIFFIGLNGIIKTSASDNNDHLFEKLKIPYVQFFFDFPMNFPFFASLSHNYLAHIFTFDREHIPIFNHFGFHNVSYLPLATSPEYFDQKSTQNKRFEISFVGSLVDDAKIFECYKNLDTPLKLSADELVNNKIKDPGFNIFTLENMLKANPGNYFYDYFWYMDSRYGNYLRKTFISYLNKHFPIKIFGNNQWTNIKKTNISPPVDYRQVMNIYNDSNINLNFSVGQLTTAINQRIFDCFGNGNFVLSDYRADLEYLFSDTRVAIPTFRTKEELREKCSYFLYHPKEREKITKTLQEIILQEHTWEHRMKTLLGILN